MSTTMKRSISFTSAALLTAACASTSVAVPDVLRPAANETAAMTLGARGVQIYECRALKEGGGSAWAFVAPEAELLDAEGKAIGRHGAGPYWQAADGSRIVGTVRARADAPAPGAVPWLLLTTTSNGPAGAFSNVTSIQRVNTAGGAAPTTPCTGDLKGTSARVSYSADYIFFTAR